MNTMSMRIMLFLSRSDDQFFWHLTCFDDIPIGGKISRMCVRNNGDIFETNKHVYVYMHYICISHAHIHIWI